MHAVIAKRIIRHKENQIRRGEKCTPGNTQEIELNHASVKTCRIISPVRLSISSNVRTYFSRVRELSVSRSSSAQSLCTATFEHCQARDDTGLASIRQLEVRPTPSCFVAVSEKGKGGLSTARGEEVRGLH